MKSKQWMKAVGVLLMVVLAVPATVLGKSDEGKKKEIQQLKTAIHKTEDETLREFYKTQKDGQSIIKNAAGYGVFSAFNMNLLLLSTTRGRGIIHDQHGSQTYMKAMKLGYGVGAGVQDFRILFVFDDPSMMKKMLDGGWFVKGDAEAVATSKGAEGVEGDVNAQPLKGVRVYKFTDNGVALQATVNTAKIWKDEDLNS